MSTSATPVTGMSLAEKVRAACEQDWDAHKGDCSGFVKAVAADLGFHLSGTANDIVRSLRAGWASAADGVAAARMAAEGKFVIGGLPDDPNGHVVVVVSGPLNRQKYPSAYWGKLGGVGKKNTTINWSWDADDRDRVEYFWADLLARSLVARSGPGAVNQSNSTPMRILGWSLEDLEKSLKKWL